MCEYKSGDFLRRARAHARSRGYSEARSVWNPERRHTRNAHMSLNSRLILQGVGGSIALGYLLHSVRRRNRDVDSKNGTASPESSEDRHDEYDTLIELLSKNDADKNRQYLRLRLKQLVVEFRLFVRGVEASADPSVVEHTSPLPPVQHTEEVPKVELPMETSVVPSTSSTATSQSAPPSAESDRFERMLKVGVPLHAVEQKIRKEGLDPATVLPNRFTTQQDENDDAASSVQVPNQAPESAKKRTFTPEEEASRTRFLKMLKMGIPVGAVHQKMQKEGIDPRLLSEELPQTLTKSSIGHGSGDQVLMTPNRRLASKPKKKCLDVVRLGKPDVVVFSELESSVSNGEIDAEALDAFATDLVSTYCSTTSNTLFRSPLGELQPSAKKRALGASTPASSDAYEKPKMRASVIPIQRAQNVGIGLRRVAMSSEDIVDLLSNCATLSTTDILAKIQDVDKLTVLESVLPSRDEMTAVSSLEPEGQVETLFKKCLALEHPPKRLLSALQYKLRFDEAKATLKSRMEVGLAQRRAVRESGALRVLLNYVLVVSNEVNKRAHELKSEKFIASKGFPISALSDVSSRRPQVIRFVLESMKKENPNFFDEIRSLSAARVEKLDELAKEIAALRKGLVAFRTVSGPSSSECAHYTRGIAELSSELEALKTETTDALKAFGEEGGGRRDLPLISAPLGSLVKIYDKMSTHKEN